MKRQLSPKKRPALGARVRFGRVARPRWLRTPGGDGVDGHCSKVWTTAGTVEQTGVHCGWRTRYDGWKPSAVFRKDEARAVSERERLVLVPWESLERLEAT